MDNSYNEISIPEIKIPDQSQGLFNAPIEDTQLKVGNNRDISGMQYFAMTISCTAGASGDATYRSINLLGLNGVQEKSYNQEILVGLGATTALITKTYTIDTPINNIFRVGPCRIFDISVRLSSVNSTLQIDYTGTMKTLLGNSSFLTSTQDHIILMNTDTTTKDITIKYNSSPAARPTFGIFIKIY